MKSITKELLKFNAFEALEQSCDFKFRDMVNMRILRENFPHESPDVDITDEELFKLVMRNDAVIMNGSMALLEELTEAVRYLIERGWHVPGNGHVIASGRKMVDALLSFSDEAYDFILQQTVFENRTLYAIEIPKYRLLKDSVKKEFKV